MNSPTVSKDGSFNVQTNDIFNLTDIPDIIALSEILSKTSTLPVVEEYYNSDNYDSASDSMMAPT